MDVCNTGRTEFSQISDLRFKMIILHMDGRQQHSQCVSSLSRAIQLLSSDGSDGGLLVDLDAEGFRAMAS